VEFYIDASIPIGVARALAEVRDDIWYPGKRGCPVRRADAGDPRWLEIAGERDWIVIMRDKRIRRRPGEKIALIDAGVRAFCMTWGNATRWETLGLLVRHWERIEDAATEPGPYIYAVTRQAVHPQALTDPREEMGP
jgi:hypothetical protein